MDNSIDFIDNEADGATYTHQPPWSSEGHPPCKKTRKTPVDSNPGQISTNYLCMDGSQGDLSFQPDFLPQVQLQVGNLNQQLVYNGPTAHTASESHSSVLTTPGMVQTSSPIAMENNQAFSCGGPSVPSQMQTSNFIAMANYPSSSSGNFSVPHHTNQMGLHQPSGALFHISKIMPKCVHSVDEREVTVIGAFLISPQEVQQSTWTCMFGNKPVPAQILKTFDNIHGLVCEAPLLENGMVDLYIICSNRRKCRVGEIEFRVRQVKDDEHVFRLGQLLGTSQSATKTWNLVAKASEMLESDSEDQFKWMRGQLRRWLFRKIDEGAVLDGEAQHVLYVVDALRYNWAKAAILEVLNIDPQDAEQYTANDRATLRARNDAVNFLEPHDAECNRGGDPVSRLPSTGHLDIKKIQQKAKSGWLDARVICEILCHPQQYTFDRCTPPTSGSLFLFDALDFNDGLKWDRGTHSTIKAIKEHPFLTYYNCGKENNPLSRRRYKLKRGPNNCTNFDMVLFHYWLDKGSKSNYKLGSNFTRGNNSDDNPNSGEEPHQYPPSGPRPVNHATRSNGVNQMEQSNAGGRQNSYHIGPGGNLLLKDALKLPDATSTECSTESSCNGHFHVEDNNDYSSSKQLLVDECMHKDSERIGNLDCCTNNQLEDVTEKTIQACLDAQKGVDGSEDGDEEHTADMVIIPGANTGLVTDPTGKTPEGLSSTSEHKGILGYRAKSITLENSSRSNQGKAMATEQSATLVGYDDGFGLSDDHALSLLPLKTNKAAQDSEPGCAAAIRIQNKFRSWKDRKYFLLTRQKIIKIQAHVKGHQVRLKKALTRGESAVYHKNGANDLHEYMCHFKTIIQKIVSEEVQSGLDKFQRNSMIDGECSGPRALQLQFCCDLPNTLFTGTRIMSEDNKPIKIILCDSITKQVVTSGPHSSIKVNVAVLDGDIHPDDSDLSKWFDRKIVRNREGKRPLLTGETTVRLENGIGFIDQVSFTDNSRWTRSGRFRLGARVVSDDIRIREAMTNLFIVKDHRHKKYQKHYPRSLKEHKKTFQTTIQEWKAKNEIVQTPSSEQEADNDQVCRGCD